MCFCVRFCRQFVLNVSQQAAIEERGENPIVSLCLLIGAASLQTIHRLHTETPEITSLCVLLQSHRVCLQLWLRWKSEHVMRSGCRSRAVSYGLITVVLQPWSCPRQRPPPPPKVKCTWGCSVCIYSEKESLFFKTCKFFWAIWCLKMFYFYDGWAGVKLWEARALGKPAGSAHETEPRTFRLSELAVKTNKRK